MNIQKIAALSGSFVALIYSQQCLLLEVDHLCESHQLQVIVLRLLTDLTMLPCNLEDGDCGEDGQTD